MAPRYNHAMFNLLGIFVAIMISHGSAGRGLLVGWESVAAAVASVVAVLLFHNSVASHLIERWHLTRLRLQAAVDQGLGAYADELRHERRQLQNRIPIVRLGTDVMILALYLAVCVGFGWVDFVRAELGVPMYLNLLPDLLPYFGMLAASWVGQWRLERVLRGSDMHPLRFASFQARTNAMTIAPILLIYAAYWALITFVPAAADLRRSFEFIEVPVLFTLVILISLFMPVVIRFVLPCSPLPDGRLRRRLETFARDRGLRVNQILLWRTGSSFFATAFVIGLISPFRYVFITDALLKRMSEDEALAVFAHELGHVHHRHLWWLIAFVLSFSIVMLGLGSGLAMLAGGSGLDLLAIGLLLAYGYAVFGYISRRFERQADAFAAQHTSPELLAGVFLKLAEGNPVALKKDGWRHFSLERRVRELLLVRTQPEYNRVFRNELLRGIGFAVAATLIGAALLVQPVRHDLATGLTNYSLIQYDRARIGGDAGREAELLAQTLRRAEALSQLGGDPALMAMLYQGIAAALTGEESDVMRRLEVEVETRRNAAEDEIERRYWERWSSIVKSRAAAAERARAHGTSFFAEIDRLDNGHS